MAYRMTITLTDQEYALLAAEAAKKIKHPMTEQEFEEKLYSDGKILNIPMRRPLTPKEQAERERLARVFAGGKLASEMVMEDRGPY